eukprot:CAMPEP_0178993708 /NCGR_PEP_ID=MMETSP0795-20121207/6856_1 /TAXON_ID=88552 /ORGANISM="Amoebophrya sp., Strain Ameob2" /LENGTH=65 /DNA_ID=CAMNT_0020685803 /DNA_START=255 /DNA_END=452 /DNA_ORIENTATION=-
MAKMMKMMSSMKMSMKKGKAMKTSIIAKGKKARLAVWRGKAKKTGGGLTKAYRFYFFPFLLVLMI